MVQCKGQIPANQTYDFPVTSLDIFRTSLAIARATPRRSQRYDGVNLIPHLRGESPGRPHTELFWRQGNKAALRQGDWKILRNPGRGQSGDWELYDLSTDISEQTDLAAKQPQKLSALRARWDDWNAQMIPPAWTPRRR